MLDDMLDHAILARRVAALDENQDAVAVPDQMALQLDQLDLQFVQVPPVAVLGRVVVRAGFAHALLRGAGHHRNRDRRRPIYL